MTFTPGNELTYGDLFAGYDGLGMGIRSVLGGRTLWWADCCRFKDGVAGHFAPHRAPCSIMGHHHPDAPNLGDVSAVDWHEVPPVDVITGGSPCQDLSHAGKRAGMKAGTRSGLWAAMCDAVDIIRPRLVVWENVRGAFSAEATSGVEPCPICLGAEPDVTLRALGRVLGDLAELGYDARWYGLRAADVGAAHSRFRVFLFATPADADAPGRPSLPHELLHAARGWAGDDAASRDRADVGFAGPLLIPTPVVSDANGSSASRREPGMHRHKLVAFVEGETLLPTPTAWEQRSDPATDDRNLLPLAVQRIGDDEPEVLLPTPKATNNENRGSDGFGLNLGEAIGVAPPRLLPTPAVNDMGEGKTPDEWDGWTADMKARHDNGNGHGASLAIESQRLAEPVLDIPETDDDDDEISFLPGLAGLISAVTERSVLMPTPLTSDANGGPTDPYHRQKKGQAEQVVDVVRQLLPTPQTVDAVFNTPASERGDKQVGLSMMGAEPTMDWKEYGPAIRRWEAVVGRPAPAPTDMSPKGQPRLSPRFVEWLMGLPDGHVTLVPGTTRQEQLKALGNGVVPQQAAAACHAFLVDTLAEIEAAR